MWPEVRLRCRRRRKRIVWRMHHRRRCWNPFAFRRRICRIFYKWNRLWWEYRWHSWWWCCWLYCYESVNSSIRLVNETQHRHTDCYNVQPVTTVNGTNFFLFCLLHSSYSAHVRVLSKLINWNCLRNNIYYWTELRYFFY